MIFVPRILFKIRTKLFQTKFFRTNYFEQISLEQNSLKENSFKQILSDKFLSNKFFQRKFFRTKMFRTKILAPSFNLIFFPPNFVWVKRRVGQIQFCPKCPILRPGANFIKLFFVCNIWFFIISLCLSLVCFWILF